MQNETQETPPRCELPDGFSPLGQPMRFESRDGKWHPVTAKPPASAPNTAWKTPPGQLISTVFTTRRTGDDTADIKVMLAEVLAEFPKADPDEVWQWITKKLDET